MLFYSYFTEEMDTQADEITCLTSPSGKADIRTPVSL